MSEPVSIREAKSKPDAATISLLEDMLEQARSGRIIGVVAVTNDVGGYRNWSAGYWLKEQVLYVMECWKHGFLFGDGR